MLSGRDLLAGGAICFVTALIAILLMAQPHFAGVLAPGAMIPGHEGFDCVECHKDAIGTTRQQAQANVAHWLRKRSSGAAFGNRPVSSAECVECHAREKDRHPIHRFREPRFLDVVNALDARSCLSCHREHRGERVSVDGTYCRHCHDPLEMKNDPLDAPHIELVKAKRWGTCLGCHDFHGNHVREAQELLDQRYDLTQIRSYLEDGPSPYGDELREEAKKP